MNNNDFTPNKHSYLETRPNPLKILLIVILCSGLFGVYSYFNYESNTVQSNGPSLDPFWRSIAQTDTVQIMLARSEIWI